MYKGGLRPLPSISQLVEKDPRLTPAQKEIKYTNSQLGSSFKTALTGRKSHSLDDAQPNQIIAHLSTATTSGC